MINICVFAGTTEGKELIKYLDDKNAAVTACVATEYGEKIILHTNAEIRTGRLDYDEMLEFFSTNKFDLVVDATHPYAVIVTENIIKSAKNSGINYIRLNRDASETSCGRYFSSIDKAIEYLSDTNGNILLTTGSNELSAFTSIPNYKERIYPRVLPLEDSVNSCKNNGYDQSHIIAMQGPFSEELNKALIKTFDIKILVTKESGRNGGFTEKINAAESCNAECVIISRPENKKGYSFEEIKSYLSNEIDKHKQEKTIKKADINKTDKDDKPKINIIGVGIGSKSQMTKDASDTIKKSDVIIGAKRMLDGYADLKKKTFCSFVPGEILEYINNNRQFKNISVLMSGDVGFYSGAKKLRDALKGYNVNMICGISSPVYMCSRLGFSWEDINLLSLHGRQSNIIHSVKTRFRTFTLVGGDCCVNDLCRLLCEYNFSGVRLYVGERLSYQDEKITVGTANELLAHSFDKLSSVIIENERYTARSNIGLEDEAFIRADNIPMTKSEIRAVSISKLRLSTDSIIYDIGAGSGSVSIEAALYAYEGTVYAIEKNQSAAELIEQNKIKFGAYNIDVVKGMAPEVLDNLPVPTHAFIGGCSGNLSKIIKKLFKKNKDIRIVINAITLETISEAVECIKRFNFKETEIINLTSARSKNLGSYNMMIAQNPIYIITMAHYNN